MHWEVENRELAKILLGGCVIGERGLDFVSKLSDPNVFRLNTDLHAPFSIAQVPVNSSEGGRSCGASLSADTIGGILTEGANPKIAAPIVERVPVCVIDDLAGPGADDKPVHGDKDMLAGRSAPRNVLAMLGVEIRHFPAAALRVP